MTFSDYTHICAAGETWDMVALVEYGDERRMVELMAANPEQGRKAVFDGGEELRLPVVEVVETSSPDSSTGTAAPEAPPWKR